MNRTSLIRTIAIAVALCVVATLVVWSGRVLTVEAERPAAIAVIWAAGAALVVRRLILLRARQRRGRDQR